MATIDQELESSKLSVEVRNLFQQANTARFTSGITHQLQKSHVREELDRCDGDLSAFTLKKDPDCGCECEEEETCELCEDALIEVCDMQECAKKLCDRTPFDGIANLLMTTKIYDYLALVEGAYAQIGNRPFKLIANKHPEITDEQLETISQFLYDYIENFLETNDVRIHELEDAFEPESLLEVTQALADEVEDEFSQSIDEALKKNGEVIERIFERTNFMREYLEVIRDTAYYPLGILWIDSDRVYKERVVKNGKLKFQTKIQSYVKRIDPCYTWFTSDWTLNKQGCGVFKLETFSHGDLMRWKDNNVLGSDNIKKSLNHVLENHPDGYRNTEAMLFTDHYLLTKGTYDVLVFRGNVSREAVNEAGLEIDDTMYEHDSYLPVEAYLVGGHVIRAKVMEIFDDLGVYTTLFRRNGDSIWGVSLATFLEPFAHLYQASIKAINDSAGRAVSLILQVDTGVIENIDDLLKVDGDGNRVLDITDDLLVEFDSTNAMASPNFKGIPIHVNEIPSNLDKLFPMLDMIFKQLEIITGIPPMLVNGGNISSALRTTSNFNAAFSASAKVIQSLLRESEQRVLKPSIKYLFDMKAMSGDMRDFLIEAEPEILLSDTLNRENNDDNKLLEGLQIIAQFSQLIPPDKMGKLINAVGRNVYNLEEDLVPDVGVLSVGDTNETAQVV